MGRRRGHAWLNDDDNVLDVTWDDIMADLGSDYDSYVSSIGWSA
ncbi:hypothetical protein AB0D12_33975 [Streptomyces sp. NPDC048479]